MFLLKLNDVAAIGFALTSVIVIIMYPFGAKVNFGDKFTCLTFEIFE